MCSCLRTSKNGKKLCKTATLENGAILLKELIASSKGKYNPIRSFSAQELQTATNNYDDTRKVKIYQYEYKLHNGFLQDRPICVMRFEVRRFLWEKQARQYCFNNIIFASQIRHKNFLKLIGCCLETQIPILVFESAGLGTLSNLIRGQPQPHFGPLVWRHRLKIAMELANAVAYLHVGFPRPIVCRKLMPSNILVDEQYAVKLFDLSLSESIPEGETHLEDYRIQGTFGYIAPEFLEGRAFNEKFDVYSYGSLLLELLTRKRIHDLEIEYSAVLDVKECIGTDILYEVIDPVIVEDGMRPEKEQQLQALIKLAFKCCSVSAEDRPTMIDVAKQLRQMYRSV